MDTSESNQDGATAPREDTAATGGPAAGTGWRRWAMDTRPLRHPAYRRLWSSTAVTAVGSQLTAVAVPKQIYDITGSSAWVGYASLAGLMPLVVFALWGGAIADSVDRRKLLLVTNAGIAVTSLLFWVQAAHRARIGHRADACCSPSSRRSSASTSPARSASVARLVDPGRNCPPPTRWVRPSCRPAWWPGPLLAGRPHPAHRPARAVPDRRPRPVHRPCGRSGGCPPCRP